MRRKEREITDINKIEKILGNAKYLHLGLFDEEYPYVVPLHYGYVMENEKLIFYVHGASEGHKLECINKNHKVFVEIDCGEKIIEADIPCQYSAEYMSIMCRGIATILQDAKEKCEALHILMKTQTGEDYEISEKMVDSVCVIKIQVDSYSAKARVR